MANDNTGIVMNLPEDAERVDRAVGIGSGRPQADPLPKMHACKLIAVFCVL